MACLLMCFIVCTPVLHSTSQCWSYRIDGVSASAMTDNGAHILAGSSSGVYYLINEHGEVMGQSDLEIEISSVDISENNMIIGTKSATLILNFTGKKLSHLIGGPVLSVAISENDSCAVSGTVEDFYIFSALRSASEIHMGVPVEYVAVSPDGGKAAAATSDRIFVFTIDGSITSKDYEISSTSSLHFLRDGSLVAGTKEGSLYLIGETADCIGRNLGSIATVESSDGTIIVGTSSGKIYLYDTSGTEITQVTVDNLVDCDISSDGLIAAAGTQKLYMFNENGEILWQKDVEDIKSVEVSSDGRKLIVTTDNGILFFCNWADTFGGTRLFPYPSRGQYSFEDFKRVWTYSVPHVVTPYIKQRNMRIAVGDVIGNGVNEIIVSGGRKVIILDSEGSVLSERDAEEEVLHIALFDIDKDIIPEIFYTVNDGRFTIFVLDFINGKFEKVEEFDFTNYFGVSYREKREAAIIPVVSYNIDEDENPEILAVVNSGYTLKPRGILAFEYPSGDVEWFYETAPGVSIDAFHDIDEDGKPEIVVSLQAPCNGSVVGNRDDCRAYLAVLELNGKEIWCKEVASGLKTLRVGVEDINKDGDIEIVGTLSDANNVSGRVFVMDRNGEIVYDKDGLDYSLWLGGITDFDGNGLKEIVVTDSNGNVSIYSYKLELLKTESISVYQQSEVEGINDIDGDGDEEIVVRVWDKSVRILNSDLEEEWNKAFEGVPVPTILVTNVSGCGNDLLILTENALEMYSFEGEEEFLCEVIFNSFLPESISPFETPESNLFENYWALAILIAILVVVSMILVWVIRKREVLGIFSTARNLRDLMILSLERRTETKYQVALESVRGVIHPAKHAREITISPKMRSEMIARIDCTSKVINTFLSLGKEPQKAEEELRKMGTVLYKNFIPRDFTQQLIHHYLVLEVEDVQIPWELMYDDEFFALKYAVSRRIKSEKVSTVPKKKRREKKALLIADPTRTLPEAVRECEYLRDYLQGYFTVTYLPPEKARKVDIMYHFSQRYDIIHYAGDLDVNTGLPLYEDIITCAEIERTLEGSPIVFLNGCCSAKTFSYDIEGLAKVFLERGAFSFIGSLWGIHDRTAAQIAAEFYKACLNYPVGEALRLSRKKYYSPSDITWAAFVMYGDPTLYLYR
jgi:WD40 repeat protein